MKKLLLWAIVILIAEATAGVRVRAQTEAVPAKPALSAAEVLFDLLNNATVEQRVRVSRFLTNKYPTLGTDLFSLINDQAPGFFAEIAPQLKQLIAGKYQRLPELIHSRLNQAPQVQTAIVAMIREKYPELISDLQALPEGEDVPARAAELIQQQYPTLLSDILATITRKFPSLLQELQHQVIASFPGLLADVTRIIVRKYPDLTGKVFALIIVKYPQLLPEVLAILTELPPPAVETSEAGGMDETAEPTAQ